MRDLHIVSPAASMNFVYCILAWACGRTKSKAQANYNMSPGNATLKLIDLKKRTESYRTSCKLSLVHRQPILVVYQPGFLLRTTCSHRLLWTSHSVDGFNPSNKSPLGQTVPVSDNMR
jgi:hypothetical protein